MPWTRLRATLILPALTEATSPFWRPIKYSLFPPLGLATLAAYFDVEDELRLFDEHVETLPDDDAPDLVLIQVYITNAYRAYALADRYRARGTYVALGGLHVTSLPEEAALHADSIFLGPAEDTCPAFLADFRRGTPRPRYVSARRTLVGVPPIRRDLIKRSHYLVPNSIVVTRGCPHHCDFCYKDAFFAGGRGFYTQTVDDALAEIQRLPGRHLYFLDDHVLGHQRFARELFQGMRGMGRIWQGAATVDSILRGDLVVDAARAGLRSLFVGFATLSEANLTAANKRQNLHRNYGDAIRRLHDLGVMINGSFVFGLDEDDDRVFDRTVDWAVDMGLTTATFHILTPYPGTALHAKLSAQRRILHQDWARYDTRQAVFAPNRLTVSELERGYWRAYQRFYEFRNILRGALTHNSWKHRAKHAAYAVGWKKCEPLWAAVIHARRLPRVLPLLESVLSEVRRPGTADGPTPSAARSLSQA